MKKLAAVSLVLIAACAPLEQVKYIPSTGDAYEIHLAREYKEYALSEADQYDWIDAQHFAEKALWVASGGQAVMPEEVKNWDIPSDNIPEAEEKRAQLVALINGDTRETHPQELAEAQMYFDCWLEQLEEGWQEKDIQTCRDGLFETLGKLTLPKPVAKIEEKAPEPVKIEEKEVPELKAEAKQYSVFFSYASSRLDDAGMQIVKQALKEIKSKEIKGITIQGYADKAGDENYNLELSRRRALAVKNAFIMQGIPSKNMEIFAYGEERPQNETPDNIEERTNRKVEILLNE